MTLAPCFPGKWPPGKHHGGGGGTCNFAVTYVHLKFLVLGNLPCREMGRWFDVTFCDSIENTSWLSNTQDISRPHEVLQHLNSSGGPLKIMKAAICSGLDIFVEAGIPWDPVLKPEITGGTPSCPIFQSWGSAVRIIRKTWTRVRPTIRLSIYRCPLIHSALTSIQSCFKRPKVYGRRKE